MKHNYHEFGSEPTCSHPSTSSMPSFCDAPFVPYQDKSLAFLLVMQMYDADSEKPLEVA